MALYWEGIKVAFRGVPVTLAVSLISTVIGILVGFVLAIMKMSRSKAANGLATVYIEIVRGTPLVVQALILAYGVPQLLQANGVDFKWDYLAVPAVLCCGFNSAAYVAEIIRGGLQAVDKGQSEAAYSLGMSRSLAMRLIIIPQALKVALPTFGNEFVALIKETSILSYVGVVEILRRGAIWNSKTFNTFQAYIGVAIVYMMITIPLGLLVKQMEKNMSTSNKAEARTAKPRLPLLKTPRSENND